MELDLVGDFYAAPMAQQKLATGQATRYVTNKRYIRKDGSRMWAHVTVSVVRDKSGKALGHAP